MSCCVDYVKLPREVLVASLGPLVKLLQAPSPVVHSYAALCIERILTVKSPSAGGVLAYVIGFSNCNIFLVVFKLAVNCSAVFQHFVHLCFAPDFLQILYFAFLFS